MVHKQTFLFLLDLGAFCDPTLVEAETALALASQVAANPGDEALLNAYDWLANQRQLRDQHSKRNRAQ